MQLNKFASAVYHHLNAIRIQRCYRRARAMAVAKARMDAVLLIQVTSGNVRLSAGTKLPDDLVAGLHFVYALAYH